MFKNNKHLLQEPEVKELLALTEKMAERFDKITIYAFSASELRDFHRKEVGII
jgi:ATP-dependent exoDNAse (exonuclease V) beta subunit